MIACRIPVFPNRIHNRQRQTCFSLLAEVHCKACQAWQEAKCNRQYIYIYIYVCIDRRPNLILVPRVGPGPGGTRAGWDPGRVGPCPGGSRAGDKIQLPFSTDLRSASTRCSETDAQTINVSRNIGSSQEQSLSP